MLFTIRMEVHLVWVALKAQIITMLILREQELQHRVRLPPPPTTPTFVPDTSEGDAIWTLIIIAVVTMIYMAKKNSLFL